MSSLPHLPQEQYALQWPEPAHAKIEDAEAKVEPCEIEFRNGAKEVGDLLHFTGHDSYFIFRPHREHAQRSQLIAVRLQNVRQMRLTRPVRLSPLSEGSVGQGQSLLGATELQVYNVEFEDGEITSGETAGHVKLPTGLFLFFQRPEGGVLRHFIPAQMLAYSQIGDPIGKLLVEENVVSEAQLAVAVEKQQEMRKLVLGDYLIEEGYITNDQLEAALAHQKSKPSLRLGEALIELGFLSGDALQAALARQRANRGRPLGQILIDMGVLDSETLNRMHARKLGMPLISLTNFNISADALKLVAADAARRLSVLPLAVEDGALIFAAPHQPDSATLSELGLLARMRVVPVIASGEEIRAKQDQFYGVADERIVDPNAIRFAHAPDDGAASERRLVDDIVHHGQILDVTEEAGSDSERALLLLVQRLTAGAIRGGTLNIQIDSEGQTRRTRISFRADDKL